MLVNLRNYHNELLKWRIFLFLFFCHHELLNPFLKALGLWTFRERKKKKHEEYHFFAFFIIIVVIISNGFMYNVKFSISFIPPCFLNDSHFSKPWYQTMKTFSVFTGIWDSEEPHWSQKKKHIFYTVLQSGYVKSEEAHGFIIFVCLVVFLLFFNQWCSTECLISDI